MCISRYICTQPYVFGTSDSVLIREVSLIHSVLYREVPLYIHIYRQWAMLHVYTVRVCSINQSNHYTGSTLELRAHACVLATAVTEPNWINTMSYNRILW